MTIHLHAEDNAELFGDDVPIMKLFFQGGMLTH